MCLNTHTYICIQTESRRSPDYGREEKKATKVCRKIRVDNREVNMDKI